MSYLSVFLGWDPREWEAYAIASGSIVSRSSEPVLVTPLCLDHLTAVVNRPLEMRDGKLWCPVSQAPMATEFACSRFAVPLVQKSGWALFADCDVLCRADIADLFALADDRYAVMCVQHHYTVAVGRKMDGQVQLPYDRKCWSSLVLWNCSHPSNRRLTREILETWPGRFLHQFRWLDDAEIGRLPVEWNHLVGEYSDEDGEKAKLLHYTRGGPWMPGFENAPLSDLWLAERRRLQVR